MATVDPLAEPGVCTHRPPSPGQSLCQCGHLQIEAQYAEAIAQAPLRLRDLTSRLGYGDGITEPQAPNDVIVAGVEQDRADAREWHENQMWRNECAAAGCSPLDDCREHDPAWGWTPTRPPRPDFDVHAVQHGEAVPVPEGWLMIVAGPVDPGGDDVVLAAWDTADMFHQYAPTEAIARALVAYLQDVIHV